MKKLLGLAALGAIVYAVFKVVNDDKVSETLWDEVTSELDLR